MRVSVKSKVCSLFWLLVCLCFPPRWAMAERLPIKAYTTADGLANQRVHRIVRDTHGFLWFCTSGGLSRFDGAHFANFGSEQGLPFPSLNDLLETSRGVYWLASNGGGVIRFTLDGGLQPSNATTARARFTTFRLGEEAAANRVNVLYRDATGAVWAGTDGGLFRMTESAGATTFTRVSLNLPGHSDLVVQINALISDRAGRLWIASRFGLLRRDADGRLVQYPIDADRETDPVYVLELDARQRLWLGHRAGLFMLPPEQMREADCRTPGICFDFTLRAVRHQPRAMNLHPKPDAARWFDERDGLRDPTVLGLLMGSDGRLWVTMSKGGLAVVENDRLSIPVVDQRLLDLQLGQMTEDSDGNLWLATSLNGARKLSRHGFSAFHTEDGLGRTISNLFETAKGELYVCSESWQISRYDGRGFITVKPKLSQSLPDSAWHSIQTTFQDHTGEWWVTTRAGLYRFPAVGDFAALAHTPPRAVYTKQNGLADENITRLYEDARGDLWIASFAPSEQTLTRWERASGAFRQYGARDGLPGFNAVWAMTEDRTGNLWLAFREGGLARYRDGRFRYFGTADGVPRGTTESLYSDPAGRLWFTVALGGLCRIDDPQADSPRITVYAQQQGLAGEMLTFLTGDAEGRIYVGANQGIQRFDPATGEIKRYTTGDGLVNASLTAAYRDRQGGLWFGTTDGLMRFTPQSDRQTAPPPALITGLRINGIEHLVSALGAPTITLPTLESGQNQLSIEYTGLSFASGEALRFDYRLEGADREWSAPSEERTINFSNLAPGKYRFAVRAINASGLHSPQPATVSFRILPPVWRRWWFLALCGGLLGIVAYAFMRTRLARLHALRESEMRFRTLAQTASDAIITIDETGTIIFANRVTEQIFGHRLNEMLGRDLTMLMPEYLRELHQSGFARYQKTGERHLSWRSIELPGLHKNGHEIPLELSFGEFEQQGQRYFTGIVRDVTERKRAAEALQQARDERLRELERVRRRIATDLHDDIGSSLTQISILSEVLRQRLKPATGALLSDGQRQINEPLQMIASASRELVDSMSDIVWAVNPQKDHLSDLTQRMRRFAADSFTARNIKFRLQLPEAEDVQLGANLRREIFLIFKESVNNMVKHSGCTEAEIELRFDEQTLVLTLQDNGRGFDPSRQSDGHGLVSMRDRAKGIGGLLEFQSRLGHGTIVRLRAPLDQSETDHYTNS
ncbi:MAG: PAS domain S-box protein [Acidobacteria bacterium]|nr:PAS domain S-box protein [Acidobacteriota bacterium]